MFQHYYPEGGWGFLVLGRDSKIIQYSVKKAVELLGVPSRIPFPMTDWYVSIIQET